MSSAMASILIVDDEEGFLHVLKIVLQRAGFLPLTAINATEAQRIVDQQRVDLIILDDMMPGMSGSDLCIKLKADDRTRHIPILMHSAHSRLHQPGYAEKIGADGVLPKPIPPREVVERVRSFFTTAAQ